MRTRNAWWSVWESGPRTATLVRLRFVPTAIMAITPTPARRMATMGLIGLPVASLSALAHGSMASTDALMDTAEATMAVTMVAATTGAGSTAVDTTADADLKVAVVSGGAMAVDSMVEAAFTAGAVSMEEVAFTVVAGIAN